MWNLTPTPTAGYILNVAHGNPPGPLRRSEREYLRTLARQVAELAAQPDQEDKRRLWFRHNALEKVRPMVLAFLEDSWEEVLPVESNVTVGDPFWGQYEWYLKHLLYRGANLDDDFVIEPDLLVGLKLRIGDWGIKAAESIRTEERGSFRWTPPLQDPGDIRKLKPASIEADVKSSHKELAAVQDVFGDILPVRLHCPFPSIGLVDTAMNLRGIQEFMLDIYDRPAWVHELMAFLSNEELRRLRFLEDGGFLTLNNRNHYVDAGGIGYTRELPLPGFDEETVRLSDLWCHAAAQGASGIGPDQHEEFILEHELPYLSLAGLNVYGCCEPYTHKFDMLKRRVPRLRRVSVSPWCSVEQAATELEDKYIFSWKPNPAMLVGQFQPEAIRMVIRDTLDKTMGCCLEIIMKDAITLDGEPQRIQRFLRIVREEIARDWNGAEAG